MKFKRSLQKHPSVFSLTLLFLVSLACVTSSNVTVPTADLKLIQTAMVGTSYQVELQTLAVGAPTNTLISTKTPEPSNTLEPSSSPIRTFSITPTETPIPTLDPTEVQILTTGSIIRIITVNKEAEYVDLENIGNQPQDLSGWLLVSEKGNQVCELGGIILPGTILRIWAGNPDGGGFDCKYNGPIWNNSELDPAVLYNNLGQEEARYP